MFCNSQLKESNLLCHYRNCVRSSNIRLTVLLYSSLESRSPTTTWNQTFVNDTFKRNCHPHFFAVIMDGKEYIKLHIYLALNFIFIVSAKQHTLNKYLVHDRLLCYWLCTRHENSHKIGTEEGRRWQRFIALMSIIKRCLRCANVTLREQRHCRAASEGWKKQTRNLWLGDIKERTVMCHSVSSMLMYPRLPLRLGRRDRCLDTGLCLLCPW